MRRFFDGVRRQQEEMARGQAAFLEAFARQGTFNVRAAALEAGVRREYHYRWLRRDEAYAARFRALLAGDEGETTLAVDEEREQRRAAGVEAEFE
jgi:hypothetical protein